MNIFTNPIATISPFAVFWIMFVSRLVTAFIEFTPEIQDHFGVFKETLAEILRITCRLHIAVERADILVERVYNRIHTARPLSQVDPNIFRNYMAITRLILSDIMQIRIEVCKIYAIIKDFHFGALVFKVHQLYDATILLNDHIQSLRRNIIILNETGMQIFNDTPTIERDIIYEPFDVMLSLGSAGGRLVRSVTRINEFFGLG